MTLDAWPLVILDAPRHAPPPRFVCPHREPCRAKAAATLPELAHLLGEHCTSYAWAQGAHCAALLGFDATEVTP